MAVSRRSRTINAPVKDVWAVIADPEHMPRWWPGVDRMEDVEEDRFTQLLGGEGPADSDGRAAAVSPEAAAPEAAAPAPAPTARSAFAPNAEPGVPSLAERVAALEEEVGALRAELEALRAGGEVTVSPTAD